MFFTLKVEAGADQSTRLRHKSKKLNYGSVTRQNRDG